MQGEDGGGESEESSALPAAELSDQPTPVDQQDHGARTRPSDPFERSSIDPRCRSTPDVDIPKDASVRSLRCGPAVNCNLPTLHLSHPCMALTGSCACPERHGPLLGLADASRSWQVMWLLQLPSHAHLTQAWHTQKSWPCAGNAQRWPPEQQDQPRKPPSEQQPIQQQRHLLLPRQRMQQTGRPHHGTPACHGRRCEIEAPVLLVAVMTALESCRGPSGASRAWAEPPCSCSAAGRGGAASEGRGLAGGQGCGGGRPGALGGGAGHGPGGSHVHIARARG